MKFPLTEPYNPHYIYINPATNTVHILMPVVGGNRVSTDNTCESLVSLREFFGLSVASGKCAIFDELNSYAIALEFDLSLLDKTSALYQQKYARLSQIKRYQSILR